MPHVEANQPCKGSVMSDFVTITDVKRKMWPQDRKNLVVKQREKNCPCCQQEGYFVQPTTYSYCFGITIIDL